MAKLIGPALGAPLSAFAHVSPVLSFDRYARRDQFRPLSGIIFDLVFEYVMAGVKQFLKVAGSLDLPVSGSVLRQIKV